MIMEKIEDLCQRINALYGALLQKELEIRGLPTYDDAGCGRRDDTPNASSGNGSHLGRPNGAKSISGVLRTAVQRRKPDDRTTASTGYDRVSAADKGPASVRPVPIA